jgi:hypothetical protein
MYVDEHLSDFTTFIRSGISGYSPDVNDILRSFGIITPLQWQFLLLALLDR